jgi:hypothetical protein
MALVDDFASFYIRVSNVPKDHSGTLSALATLGGSDVTIDSVSLTQLDDTTWRSAKNLVLIPHDADIAEMAIQDTDDFQVLRWPSSAPLDWVQGGGLMKVQFTGDNGDTSHVNLAVQTHGMAVMSLDAGTKAGQGINLEENICKPLRDMGYTMWSDAKATKKKILSDYLIGKQIWYSMTHGESPQPFLQFGGLVCSQNKDELITVADLTPLGLNYRLAMLDGCLSAQTDEYSPEKAENSDDIRPIATAFAAAFGPHAAVTGWGLTMSPSGAHKWSSDFVRNLKGGSTVQEAFDKFQREHTDATAARLFKLHVNGRDNIVDIKAKPGATY